MLGTMLKYKPNTLSNSLTSREEAIRERRRRLERGDRNFKEDNGGALEKILSMTVVGSLIKNIDKIYDGMKKRDINDYSSAKRFLKKIDPLATDKQIDDILDKISEIRKDFDEGLLKSRRESHKIVQTIEESTMIRNMEEENRQIREREQNIERERERENDKIKRDELILERSLDF